MRKFISVILWILLLNYGTNAQTVTDTDGNVYQTVTIGTQIWLKENLKTTHFNNGDLIGTTSLAINNDSTSVYHWSFNNDSLNIPDYGRLYTWFVVNDTRNVCPVGWHVPGEIEWMNLANYLGGDSVAGNQLKETGTLHWTTTNPSVTNSSDFTALPGGFRGNPTGFSNLGNVGIFWTSTSWGTNSFPRAIVYSLKTNSGALEQSVAVSNCGLSIRCINDQPTNTGSLLLPDKIIIFPNPAGRMLNISIEKNVKYHLCIFDVNGSVVLQKQLEGSLNNFDLGFLRKGSYLVRLELSGSVVKRILIVQ